MNSPFLLSSALISICFFLDHSPLFAANLVEHIAAAQNHSVEIKIANESLNSSISQRNSGYFALAPQPFANLAWTRNEFETTNEIFKPDGSRDQKIVTPLKSRDLNVGLKLPLINVPAWYKISAAQNASIAEKGRKELTANSVVERVIDLYMQVLTGQSLVAAAKQSLTTATESQKTMEQRAKLGVSTSSDVSLAVAQALTAQAILTELQSNLELASAKLLELSGLPTDERSLPTVSLEPEKDLSFWNTAELISNHPSVVSAESESLASKQQLNQNSFELFPTLSAQVAKKWTTNPGVQHSPQWSASLNLDWTPSLFAGANIETQTALAERSVLLAEKARSDLRIMIQERWQQVNVSIGKVKASIAQENAQKLALEVERQKFNSGTSLATNLLEAEKKHFSANVSQIQAKAQLTINRLLLRISTNRPLSEVPL
jgi:outer membrane protein TolC